MRAVAKKLETWSKWPSQRKSERWQPNLKQPKWKPPQHNVSSLLSEPKHKVKQQLRKVLQQSFYLQTVSSKPRYPLQLEIWRLVQRRWRKFAAQYPDFLPKTLVYTLSSRNAMRRLHDKVQQPWKRQRVQMRTLGNSQRRIWNSEQQKLKSRNWRTPWHDRALLLGRIIMHHLLPLAHHLYVIL